MTPFVSSVPFAIIQNLSLEKQSKNERADVLKHRRASHWDHHFDWGYLTEQFVLVVRVELARIRHSRLGLLPIISIPDINQFCVTPGKHGHMADCWQCHPQTPKR
jgi:hypothetical protein